MISRLLYTFERGVTFVKEHPQLVFVLLLIFVMPILFLYSGQQFLEVGRQNQDTLQKSRIGVLHDAFVSVVRTSPDTQAVQREIETFVAHNPNVTKFRVVRQSGQDFAVVAAADRSLIGRRELDATLYRAAAIQLDESLIFPLTSEDGRIWQTFRAFLVDDTPHIIFVEQSLASIDAVFADREREAYFTLVFVYLFVMVLAYWHIRITDYKHLYDEMLKANETRDMFTNMITHELRAPLTSIRGYASLIREDKTATNLARTQASKIERSAERLLAIVNDLLDVARIQAGRVKMDLATTDISPIISDVIEEQRPAASKENVALGETGTTEPHELTVDPTRLHQILTNLLSNSIKYTNEGVIEFAVTESYNEVEIRVKDTGMGIDAEDQQKLFAPFFRVNSDSVKEITGSGLGMWITKQMVELMGGSIAVESIKGVGTHIVVTFPKHTDAN